MKALLLLCIATFVVIYFLRWPIIILVALFTLFSSGIFSALIAGVFTWFLITVTHLFLYVVMGVSIQKLAQDQYKEIMK